MGYGEGERYGAGAAGNYGYSGAQNQVSASVKPAQPEISQKLIDAINSAYDKGYEAITPEQQAAAEAGLTGIGNQFSTVSNMLQQYGLGQTVDPRFSAYRDSRIGALDTAQQQQQARQGEFFGRRGLSGSSAMLNAQNNLSSQFGQQRDQTVSDIGMQQLLNQQQQLSQGMGFAGQNANIINQILGTQEMGATSRNSALTAGLETLAIPEQLKIAMLAAKNAGKTSGSSGGGGGLLGFLGL